MHGPTRRHPWSRLERSIRIALVGIVALTVAACGAPGAAAPTLDHVTIGLTYVPNIQFAPFYVADSLGYYKAAGVSVTLHHHAVGEDEFAALQAGQENMIFASGDEVLGARSHNLPIVYLAEVFTRYPVALIVPASSPIKTAADLKGHTIGVPGAYGATYIGLLALLKSAGLTQQDVKIQSIGYTQVPALMGQKVDAVMGYLNNEAIQFQQSNFPVRTLPVTATQPLISNGLAALQSELTAHPADVKAVIAATLKGVAYVDAHPNQALTISEKYVPGLSDPKNAAAAKAVLQATMPLWQPGAHPGAVDGNAWGSMATFMGSIGQLSGPVDAAKALDTSYLPK
ncbi:MAG TPA: ABC transporter substrate-binding protein [Thermomicrobiaceae bacterium]|nr:ABC transporter substrate-binding protein [Thermomicrobiaceae bacterium]